MKPEVKCRRVMVNLNQIEVCALTRLLCGEASKGQARCAKSAMWKVIEAWRAEAAVAKPRTAKEDAR